MDKRRFGPLIAYVTLGAWGGFMVGGTALDGSVTQYRDYLVVASLLAGAAIGTIFAAIKERQTRDGQ